MTTPDPNHVALIVDEAINLLVRHRQRRVSEDEARRMMTQRAVYVLKLAAGEPPAPEVSTVQFAATRQDCSTCISRDMGGEHAPCVTCFPRYSEHAPYRNYKAA